MRSWHNIWCATRTWKVFCMTRTRESGSTDSFSPTLQWHCDCEQKDIASVGVHPSHDDTISTCVANSKRVSHTCVTNSKRVGAHHDDTISLCVANSKRVSRTCVTNSKRVGARIMMTQYLHVSRARRESRVQVSWARASSMNVLSLFLHQERRFRPFFSSGVETQTDCTFSGYQGVTVQPGHGNYLMKLELCIIISQKKSKF